MRKKLNKKEALEVLEILDQMFPDARCELNYESPLDLLVATILSAQSTDVRVNIVTSELFKRVRTTDDYLNLGETSLREEIKSIGFYNNKAKNIIAACRMINEKFDGKVPESLEDLMSLPGVGRKTANVVASNVFGLPAIAVDTHVFRVSNRLGLAHSKDVLETEKELMKILPRDRWTDSHHKLIFLGRRLCKARKPMCHECNLKNICLNFKNGGSNEV